MNQPQDFNYDEALDDSVNGPLDSLEDTTGYLATQSDDFGSVFGVVLIGMMFIFVLLLLYYIYKKRLQVSKK